MGLNYYAGINDAPVSDILRKASIITENQLMAFSDSSWQYFPGTGRITVEYIIFYQVGPIYHAHMFQDQLLNPVQKVITM